MATKQSTQQCLHEPTGGLPAASAIITPSQWYMLTSLCLMLHNLLGYKHPLNTQYKLARKIQQFLTMAAVLYALLQLSYK